VRHATLPLLRAWRASTHLELQAAGNARSIRLESARRATDSARDNRFEHTGDTTDGGATRFAREAAR
jgi:hypothetical protein